MKIEKTHTSPVSPNMQVDDRCKAFIVLVDEQGYYVAAGPEVINESCRRDLSTHQHATYARRASLAKVLTYPNPRIAVSPSHSSCLLPESVQSASLRTRPLHRSREPHHARSRGTRTARTRTSSKHRPLLRLPRPQRRDPRALARKVSAVTAGARQRRKS